MKKVIHKLPKLRKLAADLAWLIQLRKKNVEMVLVY